MNGNAESVKRRKVMEKVFKGMVIQKKGAGSVRWDRNQQMAGDCHKMSDYLLPGAAIKREVFEDPKRPDTEEAYRPGVQQRLTT